MDVFQSRSWLCLPISIFPLGEARSTPRAQPMKAASSFTQSSLHRTLGPELRYSALTVSHRRKGWRKKKQTGAFTSIMIKDEVKGVLEFINYVYEIFGFKYELELSTRPEKYLGDIETWNEAEQQLTEALNEFGKPWQINEGDGAFYGPKIDIGVFDALKRKFQCATLQLDFQLPLRFKLSYSAEDEAKVERPVMLHRAILGSVERMFAILLEHYNGKWPLWLSPRQAIVCSISSNTVDYAKQVHGKLHDAGFYVDIDMTDRTIQKKVREAQLAQFNYILVVGAQEAETGEVSVRVRDGADHATMSIDAFIARLKEETAAFK